MNFRKKILPITLTLLLSVGSLGTTYAAAPENYQQKMTSWMKNDPNPMPMNMNSSTNQNYNMMSNLTPEQMLELDKAWMEKKPLKQKAPAGQKNYQQKITSWMKNDPNPMPMNMNSSTNQNYNMMSNLTPEQMLELDKAWMEKKPLKQKAPAGQKNYQQKMTSWMKNDPNPMPMNMNSSTNQNYNMMSNSTPEQMLELDKAWMEKKPLKQKAPAGQKNYQNSWSSSHQQRWSSQNCNW